MCLSIDTRLWSFDDKSWGFAPVKRYLDFSHTLVYITQFANSEFFRLVRDRLSVTAVDDRLGMTGSDESCADSLEYVVNRFLRKIGELFLCCFPSILSFGYLIREECSVGLLIGLRYS